MGTWIAAVKMMLAGTIAFVLYYLLNLPEGFWAVVTVAAVTQAGFANTLRKGSLRILGTLSGALVGYCFALLGQSSVLLMVVLFFVFIFITSFVALQKISFTYAPLVAGVTMVIILSSSIATGDLISTAVYRTFEVLLGVVVLFTINLIISQLAKRYKFASSYPASKSLSWRDFTELEFNTLYLTSALKISTAAMFTFVIWVIIRQPEGYWATITCLIVMEESIVATHVKSSLFFIANSLAAVIGGLGALLFANSIVGVLAILSISFFCFGYLIGTRNKYSLLGNMAGVALAIMLLKSPGATTTLQVIMARFFNVLFGLLVALIIIHFLKPKEAGENTHK